MKVEEVVFRRCQKGEFWVGDDIRMWSMDFLIYGEVVKCFVNDVKLLLIVNRKFVMLGEFFFEFEIDEVFMIFLCLEDEFDDFYLVFLWSLLMFLFGSS